MRRTKIFAKARPGALPVPANRDVAALTRPGILDKWGEEAAGLRAVAVGDNVITMFDTIGEDFWTGDGVTAKKVTRSSARSAIGRSPSRSIQAGGDLFEGIAIYNALREHQQEITVQVIGMAASAASIIAMAGDKVEIGAASFLMIHNCLVMAIGNRHDMAETRPSSSRSMRRCATFTRSAPASSPRHRCHDGRRDLAVRQSPRSRRASRTRCCRRIR
jgi:ATP-dependent Clp protease protease subunit